jgi:hypothetical protein
VVAIGGHVVLSATRFGQNPAGRFAVMAKWRGNLTDLLTEEQRKKIEEHLMPSFRFSEEVRV